MGTKRVIKFKVEDNYLDTPAYSKIKEVFEGNGICWQFFGGTSQLEDDPKQFYFGHNIYQDHTSVSPVGTELAPLIDKINPMALHRVRVNLMPRTEENIESGLHCDYDEGFAYPDRIDLWNTSIYYLNDCNGYTKLEDGTVIKSKGNRLLTFTGNVRHLGASCTDKKRRLVVNLNYIL
jgi:hypothetical protein